MVTGHTRKRLSIPAMHGVVMNRGSRFPITWHKSAVIRLEPIINKDMKYIPGTEITGKILQHTTNEVVSVYLQNKDYFEGIVLSRTTAGAVVASATATLGEWFSDKFLRTTKEAQVV
jgi:hypothetical protein